MARTKAAPTGKAVANWDAQLAEQAEAAAKQEASTASGQFFSTRAGQLKFNDTPLPGNHMAVIIVDSILENTFYEGDFDPDNTTPPTCYAFGRDEAEMTPHQQVIDADTYQNDTCRGCEKNEWGSAEKGRGKACGNKRRLALLPAGTMTHDPKSDKVELFDDPELFESNALAFFKLPVTSVKGYAAYVKQVAGVLHRPPHGMITIIEVIPDDKTQWRVLFKAHSKCPDEWMGALMRRHEEAAKAIEFPYPLPEEVAEKKAKAPAKGAKGNGGRKRF